MKLKKIIGIAIILITIVMILMFVHNQSEKKRVALTNNEIQMIARNNAEPEFSDDKEKYISPIDFAELRKINRDIYAWITIPGTNVDFPVVQRKDDNAYYLNRGIDGSFSANGSIYTENYNTRTFRDKVTLIYGHNMDNGDMFGQLKRYAEEEYFAQNDELFIYMPEKEIGYELVAAVTFDDRHILYSYDFNDKKQFKSFVNELLNTRAFNTRFREDVKINKDDKLLILSTCYFNNSQKRYLIVWRMLDDE